jgi:hypothetical protein
MLQAVEGRLKGEPSCVEATAIAMSFSVDPRRVRNLLLAVVSGFVLLTVVEQLVRYQASGSPVVDMLGPFDATLERSISTWFSSSLLLLCAVLMALIGYAEGRWRRHWLALAAVFVVLSVDEAAALHERTNEPVREALGTGGFLYLAWVVPAAVLLVVLAAVFRRWARDLSPDTRRRFLVAAAIFVGGAFGLEMVGGQIADRHGEFGLGQGLLAAVEEAFEMTGVVLFIQGLLLELGRRASSVTVEVDTTAPAGVPRPTRDRPSGAVSPPSPASPR